LRRDVSGGQAAAHGDAQHGVVAQRHRAGQRRHFAVVHHFERNAAPGRLQLEEQAPHAAVEQLARHAAIERAHAHFVVDVDARGAAADGVHARQMGGGAAQRIVDAVEVVLRVGLRARVPATSSLKTTFAVDHGGALAVARAQVEADAAAVQVAAQRRGEEEKADGHYSTAAARAVAIARRRGQ
jgi:hypothetical protein